ncbi:MAG: aminoglycoside phosphotransferase family protein [Bdellovibrionales bacterium]
MDLSIYKVRAGSGEAVLKVLNENGKRFESKGAAVLRCFGGNGALRLLNADGGAHLLEYVDGPQLRLLVEQGKDEFATELLCDLMIKIHSYSGPQPEGLISMERNFLSLFRRAEGEAADPIYKRGSNLARQLIVSAREVRVLHGDIHHENVLRHSTRGWLAIDPQCLFGERTYDLANAFYNPSGSASLAASPKRIARLCSTFSQRLKIDSTRILQFAFAYGCLSASWCIEDGQSPEATLRIARALEDSLS